MNSGFRILHIDYDKSIYYHKYAYKMSSFLQIMDLPMRRLLASSALLGIIGIASAEPGVNPADNAWVLFSAALVLLMIPGVGLFPGDDPVDHPISAMLAFVAGGLSAVAAVGAKVSPLPMHIDGPGGGRPPGSGPLLRPGAWEPLCGPGDRRSGEVGGVPDRPLDHRVRGASDGLGPSG